MNITLKETTLMKNIDITANQMRINQGYRVIEQIVIYVFNYDNVKNVNIHPQ